MSEKNINFDDKEIKKSKFYKHKKTFQIDDIDVNKIQSSVKQSDPGSLLKSLNL